MPTLPHPAIPWAPLGMVTLPPPWAALPGPAKLFSEEILPNIQQLSLQGALDPFSLPGRPRTASGPAAHVQPQLLAKPAASPALNALIPLVSICSAHSGHKAI